MSLEQDIQTIQNSLKEVSEQLKEHAVKASRNAELSTWAKEKIDELLIKQGELQAQLTHAQQVLAKLETRGQEGGRPRSLGEQFVNNEAVRAFLARTNPRGRVDVTFNAAITSLTTDTDGAAGDLVQNTRLPGVVALPQRRMTVRDLLSPGRMDGSTLEYVKETGFTNNAAPVAENAVKPESSMKFDLVTTSAKVIAHWVKASRQILDDASQLQSIVDQRLRYGLAYVEEQQLLNGDGTGQNLLGIVPQASAYTAPITVSGATIIDQIRLALLQAELAEYPSTGIVMNPKDWTRVELLKDNQGRYIIGNPQGNAAASLWGIPVVTTQAMQENKFLAGAFRLGAQLFDRWEARVEVSTENQDDFIRNMVTILAEERIALAVYRPEAFVYGDFGNLP